MKQRLRIYYTETDKALMWDRWQKGRTPLSAAKSNDDALMLSVLEGKI